MAKSKKESVKSLKEQQTQSERSRKSNRSKPSPGSRPSKEKATKSRSARSLTKHKPENTTQQDKTCQTQVTQKTELAPPELDKLQQMKKDALVSRATQITQVMSQAVVVTEPGFDKTQWELTKWADFKDEPNKPAAAAGLKEPDLLAAAAAGGAGDTPVGEPSVQKVSTDQVPGETKQEVGEQGDYLNEMPMVSMALMAVEIGVNVLVIILAAAASKLTKWEIWVCLIDLFVCLGFAIFTLVAFWRRMQVDEKETEHKTTRYFVNATYKNLFFSFAYWRVALYFIVFVILLYYGTCGDGFAQRHMPAYCKEPLSGGLYIAGSVFAFLNMGVPITHLHYIRNNVFAIQKF